MEKMNRMPSQLGVKQASKEDLINEAISIATQIEVIWRYHPSNPKSANLIEEYKVLNEHLNSIKKEVGGFK